MGALNTSTNGLNRTTQGLLEFVEMFKAPIKVLHPLANESGGPSPERIAAGIILLSQSLELWRVSWREPPQDAYLMRIYG